MNAKALAHTTLGRAFVRLLATIMESRLRYRFLGPEKVLQGAGIRAGQPVLEVGCGTGFFTIPAARALGDQGSLVAIDVLPASVEAGPEPDPCASGPPSGRRRTAADCAVGR